MAARHGDLGGIDRSAWFLGVLMRPAQHAFHWGAVRLRGLPTDQLTASVKSHPGAVQLDSDENSLLHRIQQDVQAQPAGVLANVAFAVQ